MIKKTRLFTPGPTPIFPAAMAALGQSEIHHRTSEFKAVYRQVLDDLKYFYGTENDVLVFTSSGTGAMEAAVVNLFSPGDHVLVATAGKFGERWVDICKAYGLAVDVAEAPYGESVPVEMVRLRMRENVYAGLLFQATETSTGVRHDVAGLAGAAKESAQPAPLVIVDAITGLGTQELDVDAWGLDVVIGGSQKALAIPPGLAFLSVSATALERAEKARLPHFYFNFLREKKAVEKGDATWTPSTALILALAQSLKYVRQLTREVLIANATLMAEATRAAAQHMGPELFATGFPANRVHRPFPPFGINFNIIIRALRDRFGIIVANGQGSLKGKIFRLAHLGYYDYPELVAVIAAMELVLHDLVVADMGGGCQLGAGVRAAQQVYAKRVVSSPPQS